MEKILDWVRRVKPDLVHLQVRTGIPALFAAAQMCHESYSNSGLSELATRCHNYAGMKWASWQAEFGCTPAIFGTWEHIDGADVAVADAFCSCPDWPTWLKVYESLLTGKLYSGALRYAADPMLYALEVWQRGWATDPAYFLGIGKWIRALWVDYADTIPRTPGKLVRVVDAGGRHLCDGWLEQDRTAVFLRDMATAQGLDTEWDPTGPAARLVWPGK